MTDAAAPPEGGHDPDTRLAEGIEHLQCAAREMIAASRAVLDVAERLVEDPDTISRIGAVVGSTAQWARSATTRADSSRDGDDNPLERIRVD